MYVTILPLCSFYYVLCYPWLDPFSVSFDTTWFSFPFTPTLYSFQVYITLLVDFYRSNVFWGSLFKCLDVDVSNLSFLFFISCLWLLFHYVAFMQEISLFVNAFMLVCKGKPLFILIIIDVWNAGLEMFTWDSILCVCKRSI